jgi:hypothetical protein
MKATKLVTGVALMAGVITAGLFADDAAKHITYTDSAKVPAGTKPEGAVYTFVDPADPAAKDIAQAGYRAIDQVGTQLVNETTRELAAKDTQLAVAVLHLKHLDMPKSAPGAPKITAVKRTSLHIRNPANTPDGADRAALIKISDQLTDEGTAAKMLVQKIEQDGKPVEWRVYRPIAVSRSCLACHGDPTKFAPGVKEALDQQYPMDQATDYSAQSWRGVIRVNVEPVAAK